MWETAVRNSHRPGRRFASNPFIRAVGGRHHRYRRSKDRLSAFLARNRKGGRALNKRIVLWLIGWSCGRSLGTVRAPRIAYRYWALANWEDRHSFQRVPPEPMLRLCERPPQPREDKGGLRRALGLVYAANAFVGVRQSGHVWQRFRSRSKAPLSVWLSAWAPGRFR